MHLLAAAFVAVLLLSVAGCAQTDVQAEDAYRIGCRAVDGAVASGSVAKKATVAGLKKLSASGQLDPEPQQWVDATISLLSAAKPEDIPAEARALIVDGCADNGFPLQNLK
ncbi:MAG TPA: hypothetical protein VKB85_15250 [Propionibacteriaceae bacterium]|nr:hypothetical protein [Propionibacteriaceae bacterium]